MAVASSRQAVRQWPVNLGYLRRRPVVLFVTAAIATGVVTMVVAMWLGGILTQSSFDGLLVGYRPGLTDFGLSASKSLVDLTSAGVIGLLLVRLLLPEQDHKPSPTAQRCLRTASKLALAWAVLGAVLTIFTWSDVTGFPVINLPFSQLFTNPFGLYPEVTDYLSLTVVALLIAVGTAIIETRLGAVVLLALALYNLVPLAVQGHRSGDIQIPSLIVHVMAVSLWVGGLVALLMHVRGKPELLAVAVPRFSAIALGCYVTIAATGVIAAYLEFDALSDLWESRYGILVMLKATALIALGALAWWHRRYTVRLIRRQDARARRAFVQLAAAEVLVMIVAVVLAVALSRTVSPDTALEHAFE
jgi:putative copper resistance protein D